MLAAERPVLRSPTTTPGDGGDPVAVVVYHIELRVAQLALHLTQHTLIVSESVCQKGGVLCNGADVGLLGEFVEGLAGAVGEPGRGHRGLDERHGAQVGVERTDHRRGVVDHVHPHISIEEWQRGLVVAEVKHQSLAGKFKDRNVIDIGPQPSSVRAAAAALRLCPDDKCGWYVVGLGAWPPLDARRVHRTRWPLLWNQWRTQQVAQGCVQWLEVTGGVRYNPRCAGRCGCFVHEARWRCVSYRPIVRQPHGRQRLALRVDGRQGPCRRTTRTMVV
mmetsp:Transcript_10500/g.25440  ORF Transcript_10500/g.25440 Transcript_10500/m.25440 type:complete len:276 (-) Transcript_10500:53-880(-)